MLSRLVKVAERKSFRLAPFIGVGCPGVIAADGSILRGSQNLPGNWSAAKFNLAKEICTRVSVAGVEPTVVVHNDAVVQGLSEIPRMTDVQRWAVLTLGTGLGNARFTNQTAAQPKKRKRSKKG
jgi:predicted NBD/HSP70 family sugar kinase